MSGPGRRTVLALAVLTLGSFAWGSVEPQPLFLQRAVETGLRFRHVNGARGRFHMPEIMGSGVALFDYDNDGDLDVYLVQGKTLDDETGAEGERREPAVQERRRGADGSRELRFTDVTEQAEVGLHAVGWAWPSETIDNDGWRDVYVTNFGSNVLYRNNGDGTFSDITASAGVDDARWSTSAAFVDYDRDGDLDLFVVNYVAFTVAGAKVCKDNAGARDYCPPGAYARSLHACSATMGRCGSRT